MMSSTSPTHITAAATTLQQQQQKHRESVSSSGSTDSPTSSQQPISISITQPTTTVTASASTSAIPPSTSTSSALSSLSNAPSDTSAVSESLSQQQQRQSISPTLQSAHTTAEVAAAASAPAISTAPPYTEFQSQLTASTQSRSQSRTSQRHSGRQAHHVAGSGAGADDSLGIHSISSNLSSLTFSQSSLHTPLYTPDYSTQHSFDTYISSYSSSRGGALNVNAGRQHHIDRQSSMPSATQTPHTHTYTPSLTRTPSTSTAVHPHGTPLLSSNPPPHRYSQQLPTSASPPHDTTSLESPLPTVNTNLYITNVPLHWTKNELDRYFSIYGNIIESRILHDRNTGLSRGIAFVRMSQIQSCHAIIATQHNFTPPGATLPLNIRFATDKSAGTAATTPQVMTHPHEQLHHVQVQPGALQQPRPMRTTPTPHTLQSYLPHQHHAAAVAAAQHHHELQQAQQMAQSQLHAQIGIPSQTHPHAATHGHTLSHTFQQQLPRLSVSTPPVIQEASHMTPVPPGTLAASPPIPTSLVTASATAVPPSTSTAVTPQTPAGGPYSLFVFHLPSFVNSQSLHQLFSGVVNVLNAEVMTHADGQSKGYGFVSVPTAFDAQRAITALNGLPIGNKFLKVAVKKQITPQTPSQRHVDTGQHHQQQQQQPAYSQSFPSMHHLPYR